LFENTLRYYPALPPEQVLQNRRFTPRELQRNTSNTDVPADRVEYDISCLQAGTKRRSWTAQQGFCPSDEFAHRKRFHEIVVGPRVEAKDPVLHRIACGQDQDRYVISSRAQFSKEV